MFVEVVEPEEQHAENSGITQLPTDTSMVPDTLHLPPGFEGIQATINPTSTELEGIEDLDAELSELSHFISSDAGN